MYYMLLLDSSALTNSESQDAWEHLCIWILLDVPVISSHHVLILFRSYPFQINKPACSIITWPADGTPTYLPVHIRCICKLAQNSRMGESRLIQTQEDS